MVIAPRCGVVAVLLTVAVVSPCIAQQEQIEAACGAESTWTIATSSDMFNDEKSCAELKSIEVIWTGENKEQLVFNAVSVILDKLVIEVSESEKLGVVAFPSLKQVSRIEVSSTSGIESISFGSVTSQTPLHILCSINVNGDINSLDIPFVGDIGAVDTIRRFDESTWQSTSDVCGEPSKDTRGLIVDSTGSINSITINKRTADVCTDDIPSLGNPSASRIHSVSVKCSGTLTQFEVNRLDAILNEVEVTTSGFGRIESVVFAGASFKSSSGSFVRRPGMTMLGNIMISTRDASRLGSVLFSHVHRLGGTLEIDGDTSNVGRIEEIKIGSLTLDDLGTFNSCKGAGLTQSGDSTCECFNGDLSFELSDSTSSCPDQRSCDSCVDVENACEFANHFIARTGCCVSGSAQITSYHFTGINSAELCVHLCDVNDGCQGVEWNPKIKSCTVYPTLSHETPTLNTGNCPTSWCFSRDDGENQRTSSTINQQPTTTIAGTTSTVAQDGTTKTTVGFDQSSGGSSPGNSTTILIIIGVVILGLLIIILLVISTKRFRNWKNGGDAPKQKKSNLQVRGQRGFDLQTMGGSSTVDNEVTPNKRFRETPASPLPEPPTGMRYDDAYLRPRNPSYLAPGVTVNTELAAALRQKKSPRGRPSNRATVYEPPPDETDEESQLDLDSYQRIEEEYVQANFESRQNSRHPMKGDIYSRADFQSRHPSYIKPNHGGSTYEAPRPSSDFMTEDLYGFSEQRFLSGAPSPQQSGNDGDDASDKIYDYGHNNGLSSATAPRRQKGKQKYPKSRDPSPEDENRDSHIYEYQYTDGLLRESTVLVEPSDSQQNETDNDEGRKNGARSKHHNKTKKGKGGSPGKKGTKSSVNIQSAPPLNNHSPAGSPKQMRSPTKRSSAPSRI